MSRDGEVREQGLWTTELYRTRLANMVPRLGDSGRFLGRYEDGRSLGEYGDTDRQGVMISCLDLLSSSTFP